MDPWKLQTFIMLATNDLLRVNFSRGYINWEVHSIFRSLSVFRVLGVGKVSLGLVGVYLQVHWYRFIFVWSYRLSWICVANHTLFYWIHPIRIWVTHLLILELDLAYKESIDGTLGRYPIVGRLLVNLWVRCEEWGICRTA